MHKFTTKYGERSGRKNEDIVKFKTLAWQKNSAGTHYSKVVDTHVFKELMLPVFIKNFLDSTHILEIGCGTGRLTRELLKACHVVTATDVSESMMAQLEEHKNLEKKILDAHELPFSNNSFDGVASLDFLSHFPTWRSLLAEQIRVLKPGGTLMFNYATEENALARELKVETNSEMPIVIAEVGTLISINDLRDVCLANGATLIQVFPYGVFYGNDIYSGFLKPKVANDVFLQFSKRFNSSRLFREKYMELERKLIVTSDPAISPKAIALVRKNI